MTIPSDGFMDGGEPYTEEEMELMEREEARKPTVVLDDGNALAVIGRCAKALHRAGYSKEEVDKFREEALSGDYDNVLQTAMKWCNVEMSD